MQHTTRLTLSLVTIASLGTMTASAWAGLGAPANPRCEYRVNPLGIDTARPRLSWEVTDDRRGAVQAAYQVVTSTDASFENVAALAWDSGKVVSDVSVNVPYAGKPLATGTRYYWKVRTWDLSGDGSEFSQISWWEMGLLRPEDWSAQWITVPAIDNEDAKMPWGDWIWHADAAGDNKTCWFRKSIQIDAADPVRAGLIKITADDVYHLYLNGRKLGSDGNWTLVKKYDVSEDFLPGKNVIAIEAFNGPASYGLIFTIRLTLASGKMLEIRSGTDIKSTAQPADNWTTLDFDDSQWGQPIVVKTYQEGPKLKEAAVAQRSRYLRKEFTARGRITRARAYATGLGLYELHLNGQRVGNDIFAPGWTKYDKRLQYQTYDVTHLLREGDNAIGAVLGNGWWSGGLGWKPDTDTESRKLCFLGQLAIEYADGTRQTIATDTTWKTHLSPITQNTFYHGESYDARLALPGWCEAGLNDSKWSSVLTFSSPSLLLVAQPDAPIRVTAERKAVQVSEPAKNTFIYDFEQNASGIARIKVKAPPDKTIEPGTRIRLRFAEILNPDGTIYRDNYRSAQVTDYYFCKGGAAEETWEPTFTYRGYRYCEVTGYPGTPDLDAVTQVVLHSAPPMAGSFECSNELINQLHRCIVWGQRSNMHSVPTDCPQRDERLGWMGDAQIFAPTSCWNMQMTDFYEKWLHDIADSQYTEGEYAGAVTDVAPVVVVSGPAAPGWGDAVVVVPWTVYQFYGDTRIIEENYDAMCKWVDYMQRHAKDGLLYEREGYGDWVPVVASPTKQVGAAYYCYSTKLLSQMAAAIGKTADAKRYAELAGRIAEAFNVAYLDVDTNSYPGGTQTANLLPLQFGITPADKRDEVFNRLVDDIVARGNHLSTGFLGTAYLMPALTDMGRHDLAWKLAIQTSYPSWGYMVLNGASTIWERWNSDKMGPDMNSRNHFAFGTVGQWFYEALAGINVDPSRPGFKRIIIRPRPVGELLWAKAEYPSPYGTIRSQWQRCGKSLTLEVTIPVNTAARIHVPTLGLTNVLIKEGLIPVSINGRPDRQPPGVDFVRVEPEATIFDVPAGRYVFTVTGE